MAGPTPSDGTAGGETSTASIIDRFDAVMTRQDEGADDNQGGEHSSRQRRDRDDDVSTPRRDARTEDDDDPSDDRDKDEGDDRSDRRRNDDDDDDDERSYDNHRDDDEQERTRQEFQPVTLTELSEKTGVPLDELMDGMTHTFTIDGEEVTLPVSELIRGHQREQTFHQRMNEVNDQRTELAEREAELTQDYQDRLQRVQQVTQIANKMLLQDLHTPEMQALRTSNPAEWSARLAEVQQRQSQLKEVFDAVTGEQARVKSEQEETQKQRFKEALEQEKSKLLKAIPNWDDALKAKVTSYARAVGFSEDEVNSIADHRLLVLADKARRYDEMVKGKGKGKPPKPKPKPSSSKTTLNPRHTSGQEPGRRESREARNERSKLRKSGKMSDAAAIFDRRFG